MKKWFNRIVTIMLAVIAVGITYFIGHVLNEFGVFSYMYDNAIQLFAFYIIGFACGLIGMLFIPGERADEGAYETALADLRSQLTDEEINYRLLQKSNESYARELQNKEILIKELAETLALTQKQYQDCYILLDQQRTEEFKKNNLSKISVGKDGKLS